MTDNILFWCAEVSVIKHLTKSFFEGQEGLYENFNNEHTFKLYNPDNYHATICELVALALEDF